MSYCILVWCSSEPGSEVRAVHRDFGKQRGVAPSRRTTAMRKYVKEFATVDDADRLMRVAIGLERSRRTGRPGRRLLPMPRFAIVPIEDADPIFVDDVPVPVQPDLF